MLQYKIETKTDEVRTHNIAFRQQLYLHFIIYILDHYLSSFAQKDLIFFICSHYSLPISLLKQRILINKFCHTNSDKDKNTYTHRVLLYIQRERERERANNSGMRELTAEPESLPKILRLSGVDFKRISYIFFASR